MTGKKVYRSKYRPRHLSWFIVDKKLCRNLLVVFPDILNTFHFLFYYTFLLLFLFFKLSSIFFPLFYRGKENWIPIHVIKLIYRYIHVHDYTLAFFLSLWKTLKLRCDEMNPSCNFPHEKRISVETTWKISVLFFLWFILKLFTYLNLNYSWQIPEKQSDPSHGVGFQGFDVKKIKLWTNEHVTHPHGTWGQLSIR